MQLVVDVNLNFPLGEICKNHIHMILKEEF